MSRSDSPPERCRSLTTEAAAFEIVGPDVLYEVVNGRVVEKPLWVRPALLASEIARHLLLFLAEHPRGQVFLHMPYAMDPTRDLQRRPDVSFVSRERWPLKRLVPRSDAWEMVPDFVVEIVNPPTAAGDIAQKVEEYFRAGVRLVWVVYPDQQKVYVYGSPTAVRILQVGDDLDGGAALPGFRLPLADLFAAEDENEPPA